MSALPKPLPLTEAEFLQLEAASDDRLEFWDGVVVAMAGSTVRHNAICLTIASLLQAQLRGKGCRAFLADVKLQIARAKVHVYPDVVVACGDAESRADGRSALHDATVVIEVLSDSTEQRDRGAKKQAYRKLPSLQEYVLIDQTQPLIEIFRRQGDIGWLEQTREAGSVLEPESLGVTLVVDDIYEGVQCDADGSAGGDTA